MGCNDYYDHNQYVRGQRALQHRKTLADLGFGTYSLHTSSLWADDVAGICKVCGAMVFVGDLTKVERLTNAYLHYGWHKEMAEKHE